jgi:hypothetical protein
MRPNLGYVRVDVLGARFTGCGDSLVSIEDEVLVVELEDVDRRDRAVRESASNCTDGTLQMRSERVEAAVEVAAASDCACDRIDWNRAESYRNSRGELAAAATEVIELDEIPAFPLADHASEHLLSRNGASPEHDPDGIGAATDGTCGVLAAVNVRLITPNRPGLNCFWGKWTVRGVRVRFGCAIDPPPGASPERQLRLYAVGCFGSYRMMSSAPGTLSIAVFPYACASTGPANSAPLL